MSGVGFTVFVNERQVAKGLPSDEQAAVLSARLGEVDRQRLAGLRGGVLVLGCDRRSDDDGTDVPGVVVAAACRAGLLSVAEVVK